MDLPKIKLEMESHQKRYIQHLKRQEEKKSNVPFLEDPFIEWYLSIFFTMTIH